MRRRPNREQPSRRINGGLFLWRPRRKPYRHDGSDEAVDPADVFEYAGVKKPSAYVDVPLMVV